MKILNFKYLIVLFASLALFTSCGDDEPEPEVSPFVGDYVITSAAVAETFPLVTTTPGFSLPVPVDTDITEAIYASLLSAVECSGDKTYLELREDNTIYMSCEGVSSGAINAGTWEELSATKLKLNMNSTAIPSSPSGFVLTVTDIVMTATTLSGTTSVPMPREMFAEAVEGYGFTLADSPTVYTVTFSLDLIKK